MADFYLAAAIVVYKESVLLVRRSDTETLAPGVWGVPCGKLEGDEGPDDAVLRELKEETGLLGKITAVAGKRQFISVWRGRRVTNLQSNYLVEPEVNPDDTDDDGMPSVTLPKDDQRSRWVPTDEISEVPGIDTHNLETVRQGLKAMSDCPVESKTSTASSWLR